MNTLPNISLPSTYPVTLPTAIPTAMSTQGQMPGQMPLNPLANSQNAFQPDLVSNVQNSSQNSVQTLVKYDEPQELNNEPKKPKTYFTYLEFNKDCVRGEQVIQKEITEKPDPGNPGPPKKIPYYLIPLSCYYDNTMIYREFCIELCEVYSSYGITSKIGLSGKLEHSIQIRFDPSNSEQAKCLTALREIYSACCIALYKQRGMVNQPHFSLDNPESVFRNLIYYPRNKQTMELIQGSSPTMFLKLFRRGKSPYVSQTLFTDVNLKPRDWDALYNTELTFIPLVHFKQIYVGSKPSIQLEVVSAIITNAQEINISSRQTETANQLKLLRPDLSSRVENQLTRLEVDRKNVIRALPVNLSGPGDDAPLAENKSSTFDGISPINRTPTSGSIPTMNFGESSSSINNLVDKAPIRSFN